MSPHRRRGGDRPSLPLGLVAASAWRAGRSLPRRVRSAGTGRQACPFHSEGYDPETIALLEECLNSACAAATGSAHVTADAALRQKLAASLMEGAALGIRDREVLIGFALKALPTFRAARARTKEPRRGLGSPVCSQVVLMGVSTLQRAHGEERGGFGPP